MENSELWGSEMTTPVPREVLGQFIVTTPELLEVLGQFIAETVDVETIAVLS